MAKTIGVISAGGDSPGLNATIRAIGKTAIGEFGMRVIGFQDGFLGLINNQTISLEGPILSNILILGGTILGTSPSQPDRVPLSDLSINPIDAIIKTYYQNNLDGLIILGGSDTQKSAYNLVQKGINIITIPNTIDNDIPFTDTTIGFDTALEIASDALDRLHSTTHSHHRIMIVEIMGHESGWLTLGAGIASGADVILIPEIPYDSHNIAEAISKRNQRGKRFSIIAVSEGAISKEDILFFEHARVVNEKIREGDEKKRIGNQLNNLKIQFTGKTLHLAKQIEEFTGFETRVTILGYLQRGGVPTTYDRILATQLGTASVSLAQEGHFGIMVAAKGLKTEAVFLEEVVNNHKTVPKDHPWMVAARNLGTSFGDI